MKAILRTRIYEEEQKSQFEFPAGRAETKSDCGNYKFSFKLVKSQGKSTYAPVLEWIAERRPPAGLELLTFEWELPSHGIKEGKIFRHGYQSWSLSAAEDLKDADIAPKIGFLHYAQENVYSEHAGEEGNWISEAYVILLPKNEDTKFFAGAVSKGEEGVKFKILTSPSSKKGTEDFFSGDIRVVYDFFRFEDFKGNKLPLTQIRVSKFTGDEAIFIKNYFAELAKNLKVKLPETQVPTGWCSWYHYYTKISEKIILQNLKELRSKNLGLKVFQIDDGYQAEIGDWLETNDRFPGGMGLLAEAIRSEKLMPGIWLAPFLVRKKSKFFQKFPEAVLKDRDGNPVPALWNPNWGIDHTYSLDVTHPASKEFLATVFKTIVKEYGYKYLKLDFLYSALLPGWTYDRSLSPHTRYAEAIKFIRKVVGKDIFILGCGAPMLPSVGLFDAMRISCDVAPFWYREKSRILVKDRNGLCTERALINDITRASMHRTLWLNDPDCLLVRKKKNSMTEAQTKIMASIMSVSGGMLFVSDDLSLVNEDRLELLQKSLALQSKCRGKTPLPVGLGTEFFPSALYNPSGYLGIWNPSNEKKEISLSLFFPWDKKNSIDYWTGKKPDSLEIDSRKKILKIEMEPWSTVVLYSGKQS